MKLPLAYTVVFAVPVILCGGVAAAYVSIGLGSAWNIIGGVLGIGAGGGIAACIVVRFAKRWGYIPSPGT